MEQFEVECLVIGAGVIGLAVARELAKQGKDVCLVEQESRVGTQTSSRNSEVIHAGIYYPKNSLKAQLCTKGRQLLYQYCHEYNIPYKKIGKLIVAKDEPQVAQLKDIQAHAIQNGVSDLQWLDGTQLRQKEAALNAYAALYSPSTGIIDSHAYMLQLLADLERFGGQLIVNTSVSASSIGQEGLVFDLPGQNAQIKAKYCVNSAGLSAIDIFKDISGFPQTCLPKAYFALGNYFSYQGKVPFSHLVYPLPEVGGLGIHLTLDMAGLIKFGPDVQWLDQEQIQDSDFQVDVSQAAKFGQAIKQYWPEFDASKLLPDYAGIRPKVSGPKDAAADFIIQTESDHGVSGLVNLFGIESPGLTASLAIAESVAELLK